jgi:S1-C subfamily serine protease
MIVRLRRQARAAMLPKGIVMLVCAILALGISSISNVSPHAIAEGIPEVVNQAKPSVALVFVSGDQFQGSGSAFVVGSNGLLVTALHVVEDASKISVVLPGGQPQPAEVMEFDSDNDLALLRIDQSGLSALVAGDSDAVQSGEEVIVIGYPVADKLGTYDVTVTKGIISAIRPQLGSHTLPPIQVDAAMNPGVSGGPVLNLSGEVIGIAVSGLSRAENVNFAGPVNAAKTLLNKYRDAGATSMPLGLPLTTVTSLVLSYQSGGIGGGGHETKLGVSCINPPQGARRLSRLRVIVNPGPLYVLTWLSLGGEAPYDSRNSFAGIRASARAVSATSDRVDVPADKICLNYEALNPMALFPVGSTFEVKYRLDYKISPQSSSVKPDDDPGLAAIKIQVAVTVRKQLLALYQREGLDAVLAKLRASLTGDDLATQAIRAERQRLLDVYEWDGPDALIAELRK